MRDTIFYVGGGKGGVGKSMVSITLVQFLIDKYGKDKTIHVIETDESNPDVARMYKDHIPVSTAVLDGNEKGWIHMGEIIEQNTGSLFVINSAARSITGIQKNGRNFSAVLESGKLPYNLVSFWPINRQRDSVMLLENFMEHVTFGSVYPVRNMYFGDIEDFTLHAKYLDESGKHVSRIAGTLNFPPLADIIADDFYTGGKMIPETLDNLGAFAAQSFMSWRNQVYAMFESTGEFESALNE